MVDNEFTSVAKSASIWVWIISRLIRSLVLLIIRGGVRWFIMLFADDGIPDGVLLIGLLNEEAAFFNATYFLNSS